MSIGSADGKIGREGEDFFEGMDFSEVENNRLSILFGITCKFGIHV
jgi:hypothetical protein